MKRFLAILLLVLTVALPSWADGDAATRSVAPGDSCSCRLLPGHMVTVSGTLCVVTTDKPCLGLREPDGTTVVFQDSPEVRKLDPAALNGENAELTGLLKDGTPYAVVTLQQLATLNQGARTVVLKSEYPKRGRCQHCGCRMQCENAAEADSVCTMCQCGKKCSECMK